MAIDWLKMRTDLYRDPRVSVIADELMHADGDLARYVSQNNQCDMSVTRNVMRNATVGALLSVWGVFRHRGKASGEDLVCEGITTSVIDDIADMPGFGDAMAIAKWIFETDEGLVFPRFFKEYNVDPEAREVSPGAERQRRYRERNKPKNDAQRDVTESVTRDVTVTHREEKRREELKANTDTRAQADLCRAALDAGIVGVNPNHPDLIAALAEGVTAVEVATTAAELIGRGKNQFPYLLATLRNRRAEAKPVNPNPGPHHANHPASRNLSAVERVKAANERAEQRAREQRDPLDAEHRVVA